MITPFRNGEVDYDAFASLIEFQIKGGIDGLVICGTTGEGSTLTDAEHREAIKFCVDRVAHRVPVIAGTGSNDTAYSVDLSRYAASVGADAMLLVTPYYNKATQKGMIACSVAVADAIDKPCILYNVPGRTGCNMLPKTVAEMAEHPNIVAIKEASGNISQIAELISLSRDKKVIVDTNIPLDILKEISDYDRVAVMLCPQSLSVERFFDRTDPEKQFLLNVIDSCENSDEVMENYKEGLARSNSREHYDEYANSGFFTVVREDNGADTRQEVCKILAEHFKLTE